MYKHTQHTNPSSVKRAVWRQALAFHGPWNNVSVVYGICAAHDCNGVEGGRCAKVRFFSGKNLWVQKRFRTRHFRGAVNFATTSLLDYQIWIVSILNRCQPFLTEPFAFWRFQIWCHLKKRLQKKGKTNGKCDSSILLLHTVLEPELS